MLTAFIARRKAAEATADGSAQGLIAFTEGRILATAALGNRHLADPWDDLANLPVPDAIATTIAALEAVGFTVRVDHPHPHLNKLARTHYTISW